MTDKVFVVKTYGEQDKTYPATEETLNNLNIKIKLTNFTEGVIKNLSLFRVLINVLNNITKVSKIFLSAWWKEP